VKVPIDGSSLADFVYTGIVLSDSCAADACGTKCMLLKQSIYMASDGHIYTLAEVQYASIFEEYIIILCSK